MTAINPSQTLINDTLTKLGRERVDGYVYYNESHVNAPVRYERSKIDAITRAFHEVRQRDLRIQPTFAGLLEMNRHLQRQLLDNGVNPDDCVLIDNFQTGKSFAEKMDAALDGMDLQDHSVVRILEPGNNDQTTPMYVAKQIAYIKEYARRKGIHLNTQVLIMGKGGHATTALFPQFAEIQAGAFSGTPEAVSLGETLAAALHEREIGAEFVEQFNEGPSDKVQIKLAKDSTNTGENVDEASRAYARDKVKPRHILVTAATPAATRQALTFAQQYSTDRSNPLAEKHYDSVTCIPLARSREFLSQALSDHQAVTELYAGLAERARFYLYSYNLAGPFIPASPIDVRDLEDLYQAYDRLSGTNNLEVSKTRSIKDLLTFFQQQFTVMENSISWNKVEGAQQRGTQHATALLTSRYDARKNFKRALTAYRAILPELGTLSEKDQKLVNKCTAILNASKEMRRPAEKRNCYLALAAMATRLERIYRTLPAG